jgi:hypothetical protein
MRLVPNARNIALKAVSMWMMYLGFLSLNAPDLIYWLFERDTNPAIWSITGNLIFVAGVIGRLVDQGLDVTRLRAWLVAGLVLIVPLSDARAQSYSLEEFDAVAVPHIARWEGEHRCNDDPSMHCAYLDRIASPPVWTICQGETKGVKPGDRYTDAQCAAMLAREVREYREGLHRYFTSVTQAERLTP